MSRIRRSLGPSDADSAIEASSERVHASFEAESRTRVFVSRLRGRGTVRFLALELSISATFLVPKPRESEHLVIPTRHRRSSGVPPMLRLTRGDAEDTHAGLHRGRWVSSETRDLCYLT